MIPVINSEKYSVLAFRFRNYLPSVFALSSLFLIFGCAAHGADKKEDLCVREFALKDAQGREHTAADWKDYDAVVLFFLGTECPVSNGYAPEMSRLANRFGKQRVLFWGIHADPDVTAADAERHAREYKLSFPVLLDPLHQLARPTGVRVVPEAILLGKGGKVRYGGRIDDKYTEDGRRREEVRTKDLEQALVAVLAGKEIARAQTRAFGCPLPEPAKKPK